MPGQQMAAGAGAAPGVADRPFMGFGRNQGRGAAGDATRPQVAGQQADPRTTAMRQAVLRAHEAGAGRGGGGFGQAAAAGAEQLPPQRQAGEIQRSTMGDFMKEQGDKIVNTFDPNKSPTDNGQALIDQGHKVATDNGVPDPGTGANMPDPNLPTPPTPPDPMGGLAGLFNNPQLMNMIGPLLSMLFGGQWGGSAGGGAQGGGDAGTGGGDPWAIIKQKMGGQLGGGAVGGSGQDGMKGLGGEVGAYGGGGTRQTSSYTPQMSPNDASSLQSRMSGGGIHDGQPRQQGQAQAASTGQGPNLPGWGQPGDNGQDETLIDWFNRNGNTNMPKGSDGSVGPANDSDVWGNPGGDVSQGMNGITSTMTDNDIAQWNRINGGSFNDVNKQAGDLLQGGIDDYGAGNQRLGDAAENAARQQMQTSVGMERDRALKEAAARRGAGGGLGEGIDTGIASSAMNAMQAGERGLTQDAYGREMGRLAGKNNSAQNLASLLTSGNQMDREELSQLMTTNKEFANQIMGLIGEIIPF